MSEREQVTLHTFLVWQLRQMKNRSQYFLWHFDGLLNFH
jgi:hypothetical protein